MSTDLDESLVRELAEPLVAQFSPAEQGELFEVLSEAHFADPEAYTRDDADHGPLAFGLPELTVLLTPVFLAAMSEALRYVVAAAMAKAYSSDACTKIAGDAIQVHGGIGFTWEHDLHLYFKRIKSNELTYGDASANRDRIADLLEL